jgi:hypothetical protein
VVLEHHPRQHHLQGVRLHLGRRNRARPAAQRRLLQDRPRHAVLQHLPASSYCRHLRRIPPRPASEARPYPLARCLSRRTAQRHNCLVVRYLSHLGYLPPPDSHRTRLHGLRTDVLVQ